MKPNYVFRILINIGNLRTEEELKGVTKGLVASLSTALKNELESEMVIISDSVSRPEVYYSLNGFYKGTDMEHEIIDVIPKENINTKCDLNEISKFDEIIKSCIFNILQKNGYDLFDIAIMMFHKAQPTTFPANLYHSMITKWLNGGEVNKINGGIKNESKSKKN